MSSAFRSIRKRKKRRKIAVLDLDITSLLDILVILLVFLLKSYNSSGVVFNVSKNIILPHSDSISLSNAGVMVQVSTDSIAVEEINLPTNGRGLNGLTTDMDGMRITSLYDELVKRKHTYKVVEKSVPEANKFSGIVNLLVDKSINYSFLKKVMFTCAEAGYKQYKFVVKGDD